MAMKNISSKEFWRFYGIFIGIIIFLFGTLFLMVRLSENKWNQGLKEAVVKELEKKQPDMWIVGKEIPLKSAFSESAALFEIRQKKSVEKYYAIIIRSATLFGHFPAVFIYNKKNGVKFIGYSAVNGKIGRLIDQSYSDSSIYYWSQRIPSIINHAEKS